MKQVECVYEDQAARQIVCGMNEQALDYMADAIHIRRLEIMVDRLQANGFAAMVRKSDTAFNLILVYGQDGGENVWATLAECRRLLDTVRNLPPAEAFARWREKVEPVTPEPYTEADARRDTRLAREQLRADLEAGRIDSHQYADLYRSTSFMDLARE